MSSSFIRIGAAILVLQICMLSDAAAGNQNSKQTGRSEISVQHDLARTTYPPYLFSGSLNPYQEKVGFVHPGDYLSEYYSCYGNFQNSYNVGLRNTLYLSHS